MEEIIPFVIYKLRLLRELHFVHFMELLRMGVIAVQRRRHRRLAVFRPSRRFGCRRRRLAVFRPSRRCRRRCHRRLAAAAVQSEDSVLGEPLSAVARQPVADLVDLVDPDVNVIRIKLI